MFKLDPSYEYLSTNPGIARWREGANGAPGAVERLTTSGTFAPSSRQLEEIEEGSRYVSVGVAERLCEKFLRDFSGNLPPNPAE